MEFSCATPHGATVTLSWSIPGLSGFTIANSDLPGGGKMSTATFNVTASTNITCIADGTVDGSDVFVKSSKALLLVQGEKIQYPCGTQN